MTSTLTDAQLVEKINGGNMAAFRTLYYRHVDAIFGLVTRILGPRRSDREDVVQEIFFQAYQSLRRFEGRSSVSTWLHRIAVNITCSHLRRTLPMTILSPVDLAPSHDDLNDEARFDARRSVRRMYDILDTLSPKNRLVFTLYEFEGLTLDRISEILQIPLHTAASRLRRSRERVAHAVASTTAKKGVEA